MRTGLSLTLAVSLALHVFVGVAVGIVHFSALPPVAPAAATMPALVWMRTIQAVVAFVPPRQSARSLPAGQVEVATRADSTEPPTPAMTMDPRSSAHLVLRSPLDPIRAPKVDSHAGTVFVLDVSGSMYEGYAGATRLAFARRVLSDAVHALPAGTPFAIVVYAERACISGPLVPANAATLAAADAYLAQEYNFGGGTDLPSGLELAQNLHPGRIVVATDGDLNAKPRALLVAERDLLLEVNHPPALTILAIAPRAAVNDDALLHQLADQMNGSYRLFAAPEQPVTAGN